MLMELHPSIAARSCEDCQKYQYDEQTGGLVMWNEQPLLRILPDLVPCRVDGCPKGTPEDSRALDERNMLAWWHNQECRAVNEFPHDPIVRRNARIIMLSEKTCQDIRQQEATQYIKTLANLATVPR
jgi:hypothetical protein